jgi:hypothetical protein
VTGLKTSSDPDEFEVLDGQQRLIAVFDFFDNELPLSKKSAAEFGAEYYNALSTSIADMRKIRKNFFSVYRQDCRSQVAKNQICTQQFEGFCKTAR